MKTIPLLLIGFGPHARRIYYPIIKNEENSTGTYIACALDLLSQKSVIESYLSQKHEKLPVYYITKVKNNKQLSLSVQKLLNSLIQKYSIKGVIIATEPLAHVGYANWALNNNLPILMDKPISATPQASTSEKAAHQILIDYHALNSSYNSIKKPNPTFLFSLMAQRRYHPAFQKMKALIREVFEKTYCPVTSIQSFHSDGQWRLPSELIDIPYHSYNEGYGKCSHTGYHSLDIVPWLLEAAQNKNTQINNVDIFTNIVRPNDFLTQIPLDNYKSYFPNFDKLNKYTTRELFDKTKYFGEIDAFNSFAFKKDDKVITLGSINLVHNGFSQRGWAHANPDLYKGNGRIRHESHFIEQGPFQALSFISYQSDQINPEKKDHIFDFGGEYHLDIHIFRNHNLFPHWKPYEKISINDLMETTITGYSRGHQEDARKLCIMEFIHYLQGNKIHPISDYSDHEKGTKLLSGLYLSTAKRFHRKNPLVTMAF